MTNRAHWGLRGPVETLQTEFAEWDLTREEWQAPRNSNVFHFHRDGRISASEHHNPNGSVSRCSYVYDESGRMTEVQSRMDDGAVHRTIHSYDDSGRLIRTVNVDEHGSSAIFETCSYDEAGRKTRVFIAPRHQPNAQYFFSIEGTDLGYGATDAATMTTLYDDREQATEALFHDANHLLLRRVTLTRDNDGRVVKEEMQLGTDQTPFPEFEKALENASPEERAQATATFAKIFGANRIMSSKTYVYDENGNRVECRLQMGNMSEEFSRYRFDEHGNPIEETTEHSHRDMNPDEAGNPQPSNEVSNRQQVRYAYQYDAHGNWTERVVSVRREQNPDFQRSNIERRKISYYDAFGF